MSISCIIIDSEPGTHEAIKQVLPGIRTIGNIEHFHVLDGAMNMIAESQVQIIFIDPSTKGMDNNMKLLKEMVSHVPHVVVMSAQPEWAKDAFDLNATDFLLKPFNAGRLMTAVGKIMQSNMTALNQHIKQRHDPFFVKSNSVLHKIERRDILVVEALADYVKIHTATKTYTAHSTMKNIEKLLGEQGFVRVHKSYIVRVDAIEKVEDNTITVGGINVPLSRTYKDALKGKIYIL